MRNALARRTSEACIDIVPSPPAEFALNAAGGLVEGAAGLCFPLALQLLRHAEAASMMRPVAPFHPPNARGRDASARELRHPNRGASFFLVQTRRATHLEPDAC